MMTNANLRELGLHYENCGWCVTELPVLASLRSVRDELEQHLGRLLGNPGARLENYHQCIGQHDHGELQMSMAKYFWSNELCYKLARAEIELLEGFIGTDLHIQQRAYLRIARPGIREDNLGFHRDTFYGQSPYEVAIHVPLVDLDSDSCMKFLSGSHLFPESRFTVISEGAADWGKGSSKHELGFPYAPKKIASGITTMTAVPIKFGEVIIFSPSVVHGQELNEGDKTRFSIDFRVVNSYAPIEIRKENTWRGYVPLATSTVSKVAKSYLMACMEEDSKVE